MRINKFFNKKTKIYSHSGKGSSIKKIKIPNVFLSILGGLLYSLAYGPFNNIFACIISLMILFYINVSSDSIKSTIINNAIFASFYAFISFTWMGNAILHFEDLAFLAFFTPFFTSAYQSIWMILLGISFLSSRIILLKFFKAQRWLLFLYPFIFAVLWVLIEHIRSVSIFAFPWNLLGTTLLDYSFGVKFIKLYSLYLLGGLLVFCITYSGIMLYFLFIQDFKRFSIAVILLSILGTILGYNFYHRNDYFNQTHNTKIITDKIGFRLINPAISQKQRWVRKELENNLLQNIKLSFKKESNNITYFIWPETSFPFIVEESISIDNVSLSTTRLIKLKTNKNKYIDYTVSFLKENQYLITGGMRSDKNKKLYNSMFLIDRKGKIVDYYDKIHLVPFSEYLPFAGLLRGLGIHDIAGLSASKEIDRDHALSHNDKSFYCMICFEGTFPLKLKSKQNTRNLNALLNLSNDAWFDNSFGPEQHLRLVRARAIESNKPLLRSSNGGITALIDANGKIIKMLKKDEAGYIDVFI